jgi:hypothetical protein
MSLTSEEIAALQARAAEADELKQRLNALDANKEAILTEKKKQADRLKELEDQEAARKKKELEDQQRYQELLKQSEDEKETLRKERDEERAAKAKVEEERVQDRLRADFLAVFNPAEVFQPDHVWGLLHSRVVDDNGKTFAIINGQKGTVADLAGSLRKDSQYAYLFKPKGGSGGMGSRPATGELAGAAGNPYLPGGRVTDRIALEASDRELAAKLKAEASAAARSQG